MTLFLANSRRLEDRIEALQKIATDRWIGLEMAPVTAQQVVNLLNYAMEVKEQANDFSGIKMILFFAYNSNFIQNGSL